MKYIVFDLEFNQDFASIQPSGKWIPKYPFEIIQIGAVMLDGNLDTISTFNRFVKPTFYTNINPFVSELTGITIEQLETQNTFPVVYQEFIAFVSESNVTESNGTETDGAKEIGTNGTEEAETNGTGKSGDDIVLCTWGKTDVVELFRNVLHHNLNEKLLPGKYINLQTAVSVHLGFSQKKLLKLQYAIEAFEINEALAYHNALHDAFYTAELLKKLNSADLKIMLYNPFQVRQRPRREKKVVDYEKLLQQFEKMYARELTNEEQDMIKLAYKMGRTQQFVRLDPPAEHSQSTGHNPSTEHQ